MLTTNAMTTVASVNDALDTGASTSRVEKVINAVSNRVEKHCARQFGYVVFPLSAPEFYQGTGEYHLWLKRWPILDVARARLDLVELSVVNDPTGAQYQSGDVQRKPQWDRTGCLFRSSRWPLAAPSYGDLTNDPNTDLDGRRWNVDVAYTAGYVLPQFRQRGSLTLGSATVTGLTDTSNLQIGYPVTGAGIPNGTTVATVASETGITLSHNATITSTAILSFDPVAPVISGAPDLPADLEDAVIREVLKRLSRPIAGLVEERTAGGWSQKFASVRDDAMGDFDRESLATFDRYAGPRRWFL